MGDTYWNDGGQPPCSCRHAWDEHGYFPPHSCIAEGCDCERYLEAIADNSDEFEKDGPETGASGSGLGATEGDGAPSTLEDK